jgi:hypothetical protein
MSIPKFDRWPKPDPQVVSLDKMRTMLRQDLDAVREAITDLARVAEVAALAVAEPRGETVLDRYSGENINTQDCESCGVKHSVYYCARFQELETKWSRNDRAVFILHSNATPSMSITEDVEDDGLSVAVAFTPHNFARAMEWLMDDGVSDTVSA